MLSLRYLTSKIHPPLTLTQRDSQKLLLLLTSSFRQHLSQEHATPTPSRPYPTDVHIRSILDNPLFNLSPRVQVKVGGANNGGMESVGARVHHGSQNSKKHTIEEFKEHVASGTATIELATICLGSQLVKMPIFRDSLPISKSNIGGTVLAWLWSSGREESLQFLSNRKFMRLLVPFMVLEGHEHRAWKWLSNLQSELKSSQSHEAEDRPADTNLQMQSDLLYLILQSKLKYSSSVDEAMNVFSNQVEGLPTWAGSHILNARRVYNPAGNLLVRHLMRLASTAEVNVLQFDKLLRQVDLWSLHRSFTRARLSLLHPVVPNPFLALEYIRYQVPRLLPKYTHKTRMDAIVLCLDTAQLLLSERREIDADWVLMFLQKNFPNEVGSLGKEVQAAEKDQETGDTESESATSLRQLEALAFS
ncbi:hypothetical protein MMC19_004287 [Ptychographa xylographoides]|nr:hypothetical protein [Ptychographa xylographoides]